MTQEQRRNNPSILITHEDEFVVNIARQQCGMNFYGVLNYIIQIPYVADPAIYDYWQFPRETIIRRCGDCEDQSFLLASLLIAIGIKARVVLGVVGGPDGQYGHAWVEFFNQHLKMWCPLESTSPNPMQFTAVVIQIHAWVEKERVIRNTGWGTVVFGDKTYGKGLKKFHFVPKDTDDRKPIEFEIDAKVDNQIIDLDNIENKDEFLKFNKDYLKLFDEKLAKTLTS